MSPVFVLILNLLEAVKKNENYKDKTVGGNIKSESNNITLKNNKSSSKNNQVISRYEGLKKKIIGLYNCTHGIVCRCRHIILHIFKQLGTVHFNEQK